MKPEQITDLRHLLAEATPGPWQVVNVDTGGKTARATVTRRTYIKPLPKGVPLADISGGSNPQEANAALIAAAVNALPALLDERERLREALEQIAANLQAAGHSEGNLGYTLTGFAYHIARAALEGGK